MASIEIQGLNRLYKKIGAIENLTTSKAMNTAVSIVHSQAKENANFSQGYQTGELKSSIHFSVTKVKGGEIGKVYTNNDHAIFVEFGTGQRGNGSYPYAGEANIKLAYKTDWAGMKAQPFMYPAYKTHEKTIKSLFKSQIKTDLRAIAYKGGI